MGVSPKFKKVAPKIAEISNPYKPLKKEPHIEKVLRAGKDVKARVKELMRLNIDRVEMDLKLQLIQELIP